MRLKGEAPLKQVRLKKAEDVRFEEDIQAEDIEVVAFEV